MLINEELAELLSDQAMLTEPVGRNASVTRPYYVEKGGEPISMEIAGVIRSERVGPPGIPNDPVVYVPLSQVPARDIKLLLRTRGDAAAVMPSVRSAIRRLDPNLALGNVRTLEQVRARTHAGTSQSASVIGTFAGIAAFLAALGLYGVLSHAVTLQRREIGIRMAMGASTKAVVSHILRAGLSMIALGLVVGLAGAVVLTRPAKSLLFEVSPLDLSALIGAAITMILIGLLAGWIPAFRATKVEPIQVLREEG